MKRHQIALLILVGILLIGSFVIAGRATAQLNGGVRYLLEAPIPDEAPIDTNARVKVSMIDFDVSVPNAEGTFTYTNKNYIRRTADIHYAVIGASNAYIIGPLQSNPTIWVYATFEDGGSPRENGDAIAFIETTQSDAMNKLLALTPIAPFPIVSGNVQIR